MKHQEMVRLAKEFLNAWNSQDEAHGFKDENGGAVTWHATFQKPSGGKIVECDGMDLILLDGEQAKHNEVYFDRTILAPLLGQ